MFNYLDFFFPSAWNCRYQPPKNILFFNQDSSQYLMMLKKISWTWPSAPNADGVYSGLRLILHPKSIRICVILLTNQPTNKQANTNGLKQPLATKTCLWVLNNAEIRHLDSTICELMFFLDRRLYRDECRGSAGRCRDGTVTQISHCSGVLSSECGKSCWHIMWIRPLHTCHCTSFLSRFL